MLSFSGRVAIVTRACRDIRRALALAGEGCDIVIASKSTESTEKLPRFHLYWCREVEALGVLDLPVRVDVRNADQVEGKATTTLKIWRRQTCRS